MAISRLVRLWIALALLLGDQSIAVDLDNHVDSNSLLLKESIVKYVNSNPESGWKAAMNTRFLNYTVSEFKRMLGVRPTPDRLVRGIPILTHSPVELPEEFDARETWPNCSTIGRILDQGHCGSCWAFGAVESLSDRFCIRFGINVSLSVNDLLSCCHDCGDGCEGGYPISAWKYFTDSGVVTEKCEPYFDEKGCSHPGCEPVYPTPKCDETCSGGTEIETWVELKHYALSAYRISSDPQSIMEEIRRNGPVEVSFSVYEDFAHYKSGVYKHVAGRMLGGHAVKLMGWGTTEEGEEYWMLANQWNRSWGDDGFFKMKRGSNECGVESNVVGGAPSPRNLITGVADITLHHPYHFLSAAH